MPTNSLYHPFHAYLLTLLTILHKKQIVHAIIQLSELVQVLKFSLEFLLVAWYLVFYNQRQGWLLEL